MENGESLAGRRVSSDSAITFHCPTVIQTKSTSELRAPKTDWQVGMKEQVVKRGGKKSKRMLCVKALRSVRQNDVDSDGATEMLSKLTRARSLLLRRCKSKWDWRGKL